MIRLNRLIMIRLKRHWRVVVISSLVPVFFFLLWRTTYKSFHSVEAESAEEPMKTPVDRSCTLSDCRFGPMLINTRQNRINFRLRNKQVILRGELGRGFDTLIGYEISYAEDQDVVNLRKAGAADARLKSYRYRGSDCIDVSWRASSCVSETLTDCIDLGNAHWYGGSELKTQLWPLEKVELPMAPYLAITNIYGPVQERLFFNSKGGGTYIPEDIPLYVSINASRNHKICLQAQYDSYWYISQNGTLPELNYTMCLASDVRSIHQLMSDRYIQKPIGTPSHDVFRYPMWSTWAQYKTRINQNLVQDFVKDIKRYNFSISQIEIDDGWAMGLGDFVFNSTSFPNPKAMVDSIHSQGIAVTLWVHPIIGIKSKSFSLLAKNGWMIRDVSGRRPALTSWHKILAGHLDFSNPDAVKWFSTELNAHKTAFGIDSFKFDAGDINLLPPVFEAHHQFLNRNSYARLYASAAAHLDPDQKRLEMRIGVRTQYIPYFVRILDRASTWSYPKGLKSVIPTCLCFGILGYPFVLPDFVSGNSYGSNPNAEMFIRWVQANALMPVMQFSLLPWAYNNKTVLDVTQDMAKLHEKYAGLIISLAKESVTTGYPIMRPLWWIAPTDEAALTVDDQFLVGDDLLVAPVVEPGQTIRRLYLPAGRWRDQLKGRVYDGGKWLNYLVTLKDLPYFTRVK